MTIKEYLDSTIEDKHRIPEGFKEDEFYWTPNYLIHVHNHNKEVPVYIITELTHYVKVYKRPLKQLRTFKRVLKNLGIIE